MAFKGTGKPGGPGGNKVAGGSPGGPKKPKPGGKGGQKVPGTSGGPMAARPGGSQPAGPSGR